MKRNNYVDGKLLKSSDLTVEQNYQNTSDLKKERTFMPNTQRKDPYPEYNFVIEIDGVAQAGFMECTGLESRTEIIRYREGSDTNTPRLLPGLNSYASIFLKRGVTDSKELYNWRKTVIDGQILRKNGSIVLHDNQHKEVARWNFREGWPCHMSGPQLNARGNEVAIEEIEICHEGFERV